MIKIGMMIGDRYEILEKIGTGGMSDVYKAKDHKLNRPVAVKVLKQEFSENANFVSKFRTEAQAAAGLMHPNIVNVYDVGDENGIYYIVMELVEGITLKKYIEKKARLSVREALTIAIQISMGIEAAHNNHIIHRDIKPQNVIISKEGKVKVTDFGIAKAATSNTITSNVMGSVHYTSPEQARGGFSDEKSDIYSLGITLFEMLTGRVPFNGDTTVAIAIKQIQEEMPSPREYVPEIPLSVEQIVLKCTQKSPDRRYQSMGELIADLKKSYTNPDEDFVKIASVDELAATRPVTKEEMETIKKAKPHEKQAEITGELPEAENDGEDEDEYDPKMDRITTILAIVVGIIICVIAILLIGKLTGIFKSSKTSTVSGTEASVSAEIEEANMVEMPVVTGMKYDDAVTTLTKLGFKVTRTTVESDDVDEGIVISASVAAGVTVDANKTEIELTVSAGSSTVTVPDVVGKLQDKAESDIKAMGLYVNVVEEYSDVVPEGQVIEQDPKGNDPAAPGSTVTIYVSLGSQIETFEMPNILGMSHDEAVALLTEYGLTVGNDVEVYSDAFGEGYVCYQSLEAGSSVTKGTVVDIQVSMGSKPPEVVYYSFKGDINPPSTAEDSDYNTDSLQAGVRVTIAKADGTVLFDTTTTSFPVSVSLENIQDSPTGTITLTYTVTIEEKTTDENGEEVIQKVEEQRQIVRNVDFTKAK